MRNCIRRKTLSGSNLISCNLATDTQPPVIPKPFVLNLPSLITVNNDGKNEKFENKNQAFPIDYTLEIFNRWGKSIFRKENYQKEWPDESISAGSYFYFLTGTRGEKYSGSVLVEK
jgi:gliding motility-associated-like protein